MWRLQKTKNHQNRSGANRSNEFYKFFLNDLIATESDRVCCYLLCLKRKHSAALRQPSVISKISFSFVLFRTSASVLTGWSCVGRRRCPTTTTTTAQTAQHNNSVARYLIEAFDTLNRVTEISMMIFDSIDFSLVSGDFPLASNASFWMIDAEWSTFVAATIRNTGCKVTQNSQRNWVWTVRWCRRHMWLPGSTAIWAASEGCNSSWTRPTPWDWMPIRRSTCGDFWSKTKALLCHVIDSILLLLHFIDCFANNLTK